MKPFLHLFFAALLFSLTAGLPAQEEGIPLTASITTAPEAIQPGEEVEVQLKLTVNPPWHVYADTPGSAGQQQMELEMKLPEGVTAVGDWVWPKYETVFEGFDVHLYEAGEHVFKRKLKIAAGSGELPVKVTLTYQACTPEFCAPVDIVELVAKLKVGEAAVAQSRP